MSTERQIAKEVLEAGANQDAISRVAAAHNLEGFRVAAIARRWGWPHLREFTVQVQLGTPIVSRAEDLGVDQDVISRFLTRAEELIAQIVTRAEAEHQAEQRRRAAEEKRAKVELFRERLAKAEAELAAAEGTEVVPAATVTEEKLPVSEPTSKELRAWAAANGVDCPVKGIVPRRVRDAYHAAHGTTPPA